MAKMRIGRSEALAAMCLFLCVCEITCKAQECGDNPMQQMLLVAKRTGRTLDHVLTILRDIDSPAYKTLSQKFRHYASCVGLVDTGYFRKRSSDTSPSSHYSPRDDDDDFHIDLDFDLPHGGNLDGKDFDLHLGHGARRTKNAMKLAAHEIKSLETLLDKVRSVKEEIDRVREYLMQHGDIEAPCEEDEPDCEPNPATEHMFLNWLDAYVNGQDENTQG